MFPIEIWNHFENEFERTNTRLEGDNNAMKCACGAANPDINKVANLFVVTKLKLGSNIKTLRKKMPFLPGSA